MPKLKSLSSKEIISIFQSFGFDVFSQKGSHIKLVRQTSFQRQILVVPNHKVLSKGTIKAIYDQSSKYISQEKLRDHFYFKVS